MKKIDLMIIGAQKAGTTSLQNYMYEHPAILGHHQIELNYFLDTEEYNKGYSSTFNKYFTVGNPETATKVVAKHAGIYTDKAALERLYEHNPDCKLVFIIRNPTRRAYSAYGMESGRGWITRPFSDIVSVLENQQKEDIMYRIFIKLGLYADYIQQLQSIFPKENIILVLFEEFEKSPTIVCQKLFKLLGIDDSFKPQVEKIHNKTVKVKSPFYSKIILWLRSERNILKRMAKAVLPHKWFNSLGNKMINANKSEQASEPLDAQTKQVLDAYFAPYNAELERLTSVDLSSWK